MPIGNNLSYGGRHHSIFRDSLVQRSLVIKGTAAITKIETDELKVNGQSVYAAVDAVQDPLNDGADKPVTSGGVYTHVLEREVILQNMISAIPDPIDSVTNGESRPVSSNAVYDAIARVVQTGMYFQNVANRQRLNHDDGYDENGNLIDPRASGDSGSNPVDEFDISTNLSDWLKIQNWGSTSANAQWINPSNWATVRVDGIVVPYAGLYRIETSITAYANLNNTTFRVGIALRFGTTTGTLPATNENSATTTLIGPIQSCCIRRQNTIQNGSVNISHVTNLAADTLVSVFSTRQGVFLASARCTAVWYACTIRATFLG